MCVSCVRGMAIVYYVHRPKGCISSSRSILGILRASSRSTCLFRSKLPGNSLLLPSSSLIHRSTTFSFNHMSLCLATDHFFNGYIITDCVVWPPFLLFFCLHVAFKGFFFFPRVSFSLPLPLPFTLPPHSISQSLVLHAAAAAPRPPRPPPQEGSKILSRRRLGRKEGRQKRLSSRR